MEGRCTEEFQPNETVLQVSESGWRRLRWRRMDGADASGHSCFIGGGGSRGVAGNGLTFKGPLHNPSTSARFATMLRSACVAESRSPRIQRAAPRTAPESSTNESALPQRPQGSRNFAPSRLSAPHFVQGGSPALAHYSAISSSRAFGVFQGVCLEAFVSQPYVAASIARALARLFC
jgi:hypothetical protein